MRFASILLFMWSSIALAAPEDPGPWPVGWQNVQVIDTQFGEGTFDARIYYPALSDGQSTVPDNSTGGFPLSVFIHGWLSPVDLYSDFVTHLASWGFVIIMPNTHTGFFATDTVDFGEDARAAMHWTEEKSLSPTSWLSGMTNDAPWSAVGHSMGGHTVFNLVGIEPRIEVAVALEPAIAGAAASVGYNNYTGTALFLSGTEDDLVPETVVMDWYEKPTSASRVLLHELQGANHYGPMNDPASFFDTLTFAEQQRLHRRYVGAYLRAEVLDELDLYSELLGQGIGNDPTIAYVDYTDPAIWSVPNAGGWTIGMAGREGQVGRIFSSQGLGGTMTPLGWVGLDVSQGTLVTQGPLGSDAVLEGMTSGLTPYFQGACFSATGGGFLTRVAEGY